MTRYGRDRSRWKRRFMARRFNCIREQIERTTIVMPCNGIGCTKTTVQQVLREIPWRAIPRKSWQRGTG